VALQNQVSESELLRVANEIKKAVEKQLSDDVSQSASDWVNGLDRLLIQQALAHTHMCLICAHISLKDYVVIR
jgi:formylmethanofuran dehydrogenase subunit E-like metal-binding protein